MKKRFILAAALVIAPAPATAGIVVLGNSAARSCYLAAESPVAPRVSDIRSCTDALGDGRTTGDEVVATHVNRGILHLRRGNIDAALADFDRAIALDPEQPESYLNRGHALILREQAAPALSMFEQAISRNTRRPALAYYGRGMANETLGNLMAAYRDYTRASQLDPEWAVPREDLSRFRVVPRS
jgi:tetratricopeptide (TPR) repeat protein